jgi:hypothetical protein
LPEGRRGEHRLVAYNGEKKPRESPSRLKSIDTLTDKACSGQIEGKEKCPLAVAFLWGKCMESLYE